MKLLLENWRKFVNEDDNLQKYTLLLEQKFNEEIFNQVKELFVKMLNEGVSTKDLTILIEKEPDPSRRTFLKKAAKAAAVVGGAAAVGSGLMPKIGKAGSELLKRYEIRDRGVLAMIEKLKKNAVTDYRSTGKSGRRLVRQLADDFFDKDDQKAAAAYDNRMYPRLVSLIQKLPVGQSPINNKQVVAVVQKQRMEDGSVRPVQMILNSNQPWHDEAKFQAAIGGPRIATLSHEFEHAVTGFVNQITKGKYNLEQLAVEELGKIFDLSGIGQSGGLSATGEGWGKDVTEIYAEFKALRTRLGGVVQPDDLEILCRSKAAIYDRGVLPQNVGAGDWTINYRHLKLLKCPIDRHSARAANRFAALDKKIDQLGRSAGRSKTGYAEQKEKPNTKEAKKKIIWEAD